MSVQRSASALSRERVEHALYNLRRRYVVYYLSRNDGIANLDELSTQVAAWENDAPTDSVPDDRWKSVYSALHQTHLPKLEEIGLLWYDRERTRVELTPRGRNLTLYLASDGFTASPWPHRYLLVCALGALVGVLLWLHVSPVADLAPLAWLAIFLGVLAGVTVAHVQSRRRWYHRFSGARPDFFLEYDD